MTRDEFTIFYATNSGMAVSELLRLGFRAEPCDCDEEICKGWQMVTQDEPDMQVTKES